METLRHKIFGVGRVLSVDDKSVTVKFDKDGCEKRFLIPESFEGDFFELQEPLKSLVEDAKRARLEARAAAREAIAARSAAAAAAEVSVKKNRSSKKPANIKIKGTVETSFEAYLIASGYSEETPSGNPSTVSSYIKSVESVMEDEGITWQTLSLKISDLVQLYGKGGAKEHIGKKSNDTVINALRRFEDFVKNP